MSNVLDLDVADLGPAALRAWRWWMGELRALAGPLMRERAPRSGRWPVLDVAADGAFGPTQDGDRSAPTRAKAVALRLPAERVLRRTVAMPQLAGRDLERLVRLDADRLTPFAAGNAYHHIRAGDADAGAATRDVRLLSVDKAFADAALDQAARQGHEVRAVLAPDERDDTDLLPVMQVDRPDPRTRTRRRLWLAAATLVIVNLGLWVWRDVQATQALETRASQINARARRVERATQEEIALRGLLAHADAGADRGDPLFALDAVARALAPGATLQRLEWRGGRVRLAGVKPAELDIAAALKADGAFVDVRPAAAGAASSDRFDLMVQVSQLRRPAS